MSECVDLSELITNYIDCTIPDTWQFGGTIVYDGFMRNSGPLGKLGEFFDHWQTLNRIARSRRFYGEIEDESEI